MKNSLTAEGLWNIKYCIKHVHVKRITFILILRLCFKANATPCFCFLISISAGFAFYVVFTCYILIFFHLFRQIQWIKNNIHTKYEETKTEKTKWKDFVFHKKNKSTNIIEKYLNKVVHLGYIMIYFTYFFLFNF